MSPSPIHRSGTQMEAGAVLYVGEGFAAPSPAVAAPECRDAAPGAASRS
jgi:hypothetical protein